MILYSDVERLLVAKPSKINFFGIDAHDLAHKLISVSITLDLEIFYLLVVWLSRAWASRIEKMWQGRDKEQDRKGHVQRS